MEIALWAGGSLVVGFAIAYLLLRLSGFGRGGDSIKLARAEAERDAARDQLLQLKADRQTLKESIQAFSADLLKENRVEFLKHAEERLGWAEEKHKSELTQRHEAIEKQFKGVQEKMDSFQEMNRKIELQRIKEFGALSQQLLGLEGQTRAVEKASHSLSTALRGSSQSRGKWGEMALRNIVDVAGMTEHCDFEEQDQKDADKRPDMVVRLPGEGKIPIDSKVPFIDYERALEATDPVDQKKHLEAHGKSVRATMLELAKRDYPSVVGGKVDYTVMFIRSKAWLRPHSPLNRIFSRRRSSIRYSSPPQ